jgi:signal transduction histidine kinase
MSDLLIDARLARLQELEQRFDEAVERAKLDAMKELAYGAGHEINNPLANIATRAQTLLHEETDPEKRRKLAAINAQAFRAHEMIADLMLFARPPQLRPESVDLQALLRRVADELAAEAGAASVAIVVHPSKASLRANADPIQLAVAIRAICINAIEAMLNGGKIEVYASRHWEGEAPPEPRDGEAAAKPAMQRTAEARQEPRPPNDGRDYVQIIIADNGPGIPADIRHKIFDPFFSGREAGRGLGFGLAKAWRIVTVHGGTIAVRETPGGGATFVITLPFSCAASTNHLSISST